MRAMDVLQAFPNFVLALGIAAALGPSLPNLIVAIALTNVPVYARLMRSQVLTQRTAPYALAAVGVGNPMARVLFVHLLPNTWSPILVQATLQSGWAILQAAGLSFIGLGVRVPTPEWGVMIGMGVAAGHRGPVVGGVLPRPRHHGRGDRPQPAGRRAPGLARPQRR